MRERERERRVRISTGIWQVEQWQGWSRLLLPLPQFEEAIDKTTASQTRSSFSLRALPVRGRLACQAERACILCPQSTLGDGRRPGPSTAVWCGQLVNFLITGGSSNLTDSKNHRFRSFVRKKNQNHRTATCSQLSQWKKKKFEIREPPVMDISETSKNQPVTFYYTKTSLFSFLIPLGQVVICPCWKPEGICGSSKVWKWLKVHSHLVLGTPPSVESVP
jgi:hypothetical protein